MNSTTGNTGLMRMHHAAERAQVAAWRIIATGALLGLAWGILARAWMRLISTTPEFTWSGTLFILALTTVTGTSLATVEALRRSGKGWWRHLLGIPALLLFASQGILMAPMALLGGLALSGRGPRWIRLTVAALAIAPIVLIATSDLDFGPSPIGAMGGLTLLCLTLAAGWSAVFRPRQIRPAHPPAR
jgi:hypothetical protein